jgi:branched-chain amino acid transport system substrate-binding protein
VVLVVLSVVATACGARFKDDGTTAAAAGSPAGNGAFTNESAASDATAATVPGGGPAAGGQAITATTRAGSRAGGAGGAVPSDAGIGSTQGVTDTTIKLGYLLPLTGAAPVPNNVDTGTKVYWKYVNGKGGINGRTVLDPIIEDTGSSGTQAVDKAKKLIETDKVFVIVVLDRLEIQEQVGKYLDDRKFPNIEVQTPANLNPAQAWTFGVTIDHAVQGALVADYFVKVLHADKTALVYENTPALAPGRDAFKAELKKLGAPDPYVSAIDGKGTDFSTQAQEIGTRKPGAVWLYMAPEPAAKVANQTDALWHPTWFANSISWNFDLIFATGKTAFRGARAFSPWVALSDPRTATYQQAYRDQGGTPDDTGLVGWGIAEIAAEGLRRPGRALGQNAFRVAMQAMNYRPDIWAPIAFGPGVREGANVISVLKADTDTGAPDHWLVERDFTASF